MKSLNSLTIKSLDLQTDKEIQEFINKKNMCVSGIPRLVQISKKTKTAILYNPQCGLWKYQILRAYNCVRLQQLADL